MGEGIFFDDTLVASAIISCVLRFAVEVPLRVAVDALAQYAWEKNLFSGPITRGGEAGVLTWS